MANSPYDRYGKPYDVTRVLTPEHTFDEEGYNKYSPLYLPASYAITYLVAFALSSAMIVHTLLYHGRTLLHGLTQTRIEKDDIHAKLMRAYPEVPDWWYLMTFIACFALAIVTAEVWHTDIPVWALLLAIALPVTYMVPSGYVYALTGQNVSRAHWRHRRIADTPPSADHYQPARADHSWHDPAREAAPQHGKHHHLTSRIFD